MATKKTPAAASVTATAKQIVSKFKLPKTVAQAADLLYETRAKRYEANKIVTAYQANEAILTQFIIDQLPKSNATGISGKTANVKVETKPIRQVKNWESFWAYVFKTKNTALLEKRASRSAMDEIAEVSKKEVPGTEIFNAKVVSCTKI